MMSRIMVFILAKVGKVGRLFIETYGCLRTFRVIMNIY